MTQYSKIIVSFLILLLLAACNGTPQLSQRDHTSNLLEELEHDAQLPVNYDITIDTLIEDEYVPVTPPDEIPSFHTLARTADITRYPCSNCHTPALEPLTATTPDQAHWDITLNHADTDIMNCTTCHDLDNPDTLHTLTGSPISFDHSYQQCAQCHTPQYEDWLGGAHGKRIAGWAPPRVVEPCVACHNPHRPALDKRWPAIINGNTNDNTHE
ncbi:MAG TPA: hypothetical protein VLL52_22255 [Anaerolineae bacterium]|nr:hypothetical protein [Anaerolineae bacterium]